MQRTPTASPAAQSERIGEPLLSVRDLQTHFPLDEGTVVAVDGASFESPSGPDARHRWRERLRQERNCKIHPRYPGQAR